MLEPPVGYEPGTLFLGGPFDGRHLQMCPWQRVYYVVKGGKPVARYVRHNNSISLLTCPVGIA